MHKISFLVLIITILFGCESNQSTNGNGEAPTQMEEPTKAIKNLNVSPKKQEQEALPSEEKKEEAPKEIALNPEAIIPYNLKEPHQTFLLPRRLKEISGLSISKYQNHLVAINDEEGELFFIDKSSGEIMNEVKFGKNDDYEGVEVVRDEIWVVENSGKLHRVKKVNTDKQKTKEYDNKLDKSYDVEGLGLDGINNRLLIACKGKAGEGKEYKKKRAIYAFDLGKKNFSKEPLYVVSRVDIKKFIESIQEEKNLAEEFIAFLDADRDTDAFAPSGIAVHPISHRIYIISSVGKLLVILNENGTIFHIQPLDPEVHPQPEGICFDEDGTLYISSEGKFGKGRINKFERL